MVAKQDLFGLFQGDTWSLAVSNVLSVNATPVDMSSDKIWMSLRKPDTTLVLDHSETIPSGTAAVSGAHTLTIPSSLTGAVAPGLYNYDVQWVGVGTVTTLFNGVIDVLSDVTRSI